MRMESGFMMVYEENEVRLVIKDDEMKDEACYLRMLLAKLGPRLASAALAGLLEADEVCALGRSESDSMRTRLCGLELDAPPAASDALEAPATSPPTSSALLFLLGLIEDLDPPLAAAVVEAAELPTRLQKSA